MEVLAIITARGGSKRIPEKNIKEFCGKPIIAYSIESALKSNIFDEVMVSTDSNRIKEIAERYGARIPFFRSEETSSDYATTAEVLSEVLSNYAANGREFDYFACIYPTAPFVTAHRLKDAFNSLLETNADSLKTIVKYSFPPQRAMIIQNNKLVYQYPEYAKSRSQDLEPIYHDCGQFYFCKTDVFLKNKNLTTDNTIPYIVPEEEVQDIDNESDWFIAEAKYNSLIDRYRDES